MILLNRTREYHKPVFVTEIIFCNNPNAKALLVEGDHGDTHFWVSLQTYTIPAAVY